MKRTGLFLMVLLICAIPLCSQIVIIPDKAFLNGLISTEEAELITYLDIAGNWDKGKRGEIKSLKGIEAFVNLDTLRCNYNQLSSLDRSNNHSLVWLNCRMNHLSSLDVSTCKTLARLVCDNNLNPLFCSFSLII